MVLRSNPYQEFHEECLRRARDWPAELASELQWLNGERAAALKGFETLDLPTRKTENWKYTSINEIVQSNILNMAAKNDASTANLLTGDFYQINITNGHVDTGELLTSTGGIHLDQAIEIIPFSTSVPGHQQLIKTHLNKTFESQQHPFAAWNSSLLQDGLLIRVTTDSKAGKPICINHISDNDGNSFSSHTRLLIVIDSGSEANIIENFTDLQGHTKSMNNALSEIVLGENSKLSHFIVNGESLNHIHTGASFVEQERGSQFTQHNFATGGSLKRRDIQVKLLGEQADCKMFGAYLIGGKSHVDYHTTIEHVAPHCTSEENFKGIVTDKGKAVFNGRIHIHQDAQKSSAQMNNKNLLLTNTAEVNTKPELEIYADDVKCAHGATVGQLDEAALYYFQTRGISKDEANHMLSHAFIELIIDEISINSVKEHVESITENFFDQRQR